VAFQRKKPAAIGAKAPFPGFIELALATSVDKAPRGDRWIHEIKFDGYRVQVHLANSEIKLLTRRGHDWTHRFRKTAADAWHISAGSAIIDGEVVVPAADGTTDFSVLQNEVKDRSTKIVLVAFDLLYLNGYDLRKLPLMEHKALLKKLVDKTDIQFSESFEVDGPEMFKHACKTGLEGVVSKVRNSKYSSADQTTGPRLHVRSARRYQSRVSRSMEITGMDFISVGAKAPTWSMPARSITASTRTTQRSCARGLSH
jgi:bifunctional non-homologous end joining protein LigD